jgi:hypothetical protein
MPPSDEPRKIPPPPPFDLDTDPADEIDVDLADVEADDKDDLEAAIIERATLPDDVEFLGEYPSVEDYLRSMIEPEISAPCSWLLDRSA